MNTFAKSALVLGTVSVLALGSMTASEARSGRWVAGAAVVGAGIALGAAAANAHAYNNGYYGDGYAYAPGYNDYAYEPAYTYEPAYSYAPAYGYYGGPDLSTQSAPRHHDARGAYNSNTLAPWQDRRMQGID
jgi:hypothetical protein